MKFTPGITLALLLFTSVTSLAQVSPRDVNGALYTSEGLRFDTNVSFSLRMTLAGDETLLDTATVGDDINIFATIRPEAEDIGRPADITIVDYLPHLPKKVLRMRDTDGNWINWNGGLNTLIPSIEGQLLEAELDVEIFSGQLSIADNHDIFVAYLVDGMLFFTPLSMRLKVEEVVVETGALEQAIALFNSTISPTIVHGVCIACHVSGGSADGQALHIFATMGNPDHLSINFAEFEQVHSAKGTNYILNKARGLEGHVGGNVLPFGSTQYNNLQDFLELLDEASQ